ncbi:TetR family transcriptional regulator C-terminal domain-containing protein [Rhodococcus sp. NPDC060090]|uniref:TetR family transcriptional regulator C-terminal domain-containing protein n=1 Tax=Rhodococcus sp. NPDC060090 TaxID=3347056 RepID=UPI0036649B57
MLEELVPLDDGRSREAVILMEVITAARINPAFAPVTSRMAADLDTVLVEALNMMRVKQPEMEAARLAALIAGLSLNVTTPHGKVDPETI